jgi:endonuclease/exonuclease/phosphatase family metal-dependent hydrolase
MNRKKRNLADAILKWLTFIAVGLLVLSKLLTFFSPESLGKAGLYSLATPVVLLVNIALLLYWLIRLSSIFWLVLAVLLLNMGFIIRFYKFNGKKIIRANDLKVMSYNVRMFNRYSWLPEDSIKDKIQSFIFAKSPDVICVQEYTRTNRYNEIYPYKFEVFEDNYGGFGHAVFSKYPIVHKGSFDFKESANNVLWVDIVVGRDTMRIYNVHLESIGINPNKENFGQKNTGQLADRLTRAFYKQQKQVEELLKHKSDSRYPVVIAGDFNNTAFSWAYRELSKGMNDAFVEAGKGFGRTFRFVFPLRIDFILTGKSLRVQHFKTYKVRYSDHYPIMCRIALPSAGDNSK